MIMPANMKGKKGKKTKGPKRVRKPY